MNREGLQSRATAAVAQALSLPRRDSSRRSCQGQRLPAQVQAPQTESLRHVCHSLKFLSATAKINSHCADVAQALKPAAPRFVSALLPVLARGTISRGRRLGCACNSDSAETNLGAAGRGPRHICKVILARFLKRSSVSTIGSKRRRAPAVRNFTATKGIVKSRA
jgi:hypothetical protein